MRKSCFSLLAPVLCVLLLCAFSGCGRTEVITDDGSDAQTEVLSAWPDNEYTREIPRPSVGTVTCGIDNTANGKYSVCLEDFTPQDAAEYAEDLKSAGFSEAAATTEDASSAYLLQKDTVWVSIAQSGTTVEICVMIPQ